MKFDLILKRREDAKSALEHAKWRHQSAVEHYEKTKKTKQPEIPMDDFSRLTQMVADGTESIKYLEETIKRAQTNVEIAEARINKLNPIIDDLSAQMP
jgi:t-SNARE complex subunit (syntaxin)